jgi:hypothetical protein
MTGNNVLIAQTLLSRDSRVSSFPADGVYGLDSSAAVSQFQTGNGLKETGILDSVTAQLLLDLCSADGYRDTGFSAESMGYLYKVHVAVYQNRSIESIGTLFDENNIMIMSFPIRAHGHRDDGTSAPWPDMGDGDYGLNQFTGSGNTVTGLIEIDLNSPEPNPDLYGPWPVNRFVRGLAGNAALLLPNIRDGILLHTGNWTSASGGWNPTMPMPDSSGCIHSHPNDVERIQDELIKLGVVVNDNTFSGKDYPYKPQGIAVVELIN